MDDTDNPLPNPDADPSADAPPPPDDASGEQTVLHCNDADLADIHACLSGNDAAYTHIIGRYQTLIAKQMQGFARDPETREELVQDVFLEVFKSLESFRGDAPFEHWVRKVASRVGYRHWKRQGNKPVLFPIEDWDAPVNTETEEPEEIDPKRAATLLHWLLGHLKPEDRLVLTLLYFESLSVQQIAQRMGWNRAIVKMRVYRAKRKLQKLITAEGIEFPLL